MLYENRGVLNSMKLKKKNRIFLMVTCVLVIGGLFGFINLNKTNKIERVLKTEYYAYLPKAAQNYIKDVYEETGEVLFDTESLDKLQGEYNEKIRLF